MLFNSYIFVLLFLPLSIAGYFILNNAKKYKLATAFLLVMSLWFYGYFNVSYLAIIITSICFNYVCHLLFTSKSMQTNLKRKLILLLGLIFNLGLLFYFKYFNFFAINVNALFKLDIVTRNIVLPLGISFFTFQQIGFIVDSYHGETPRYDFFNYALFVSFFPQLIAGPIVSHDTLVPQFHDMEKKHFNAYNASYGLLHFALGLAKKVLIADVIGVFVDQCYANTAGLNTKLAVLAMLGYITQLYFDFSGYSDMAIGMARMVNIDIPINFDSPFSIKAPTIADYWKRYHITLTSFFRKYVYIPLGGNRKSEARTFLNIFIVFFLSGVWHGAGWTYILWGSIHGVLMCLCRLFSKQLKRVPKLPLWIVTTILNSMSCAIFRAASLGDAALFFRGLVSGFGSASFSIDKITLITFVIGFLIMAIGFNAHQIAEKFKPNIWWSFLTIGLLVLCILSFQKQSIFLYFNF